jgi:hypothetical protein
VVTPQEVEVVVEVAEVEVVVEAVEAEEVEERQQLADKQQEEEDPNYWELNPLTLLETDEMSIDSWPT